MKRIIMVLLVAVFILYAWTDTVKASGEYQICSRDVLSISVWGVDGLKVDNLEVREDGKIAFPLVGEIDVIGLSPREVMKLISVALEGYITQPNVTVNIIKYHTTRIYVVGEVTHPGLYELEKQHNLLDGITIAGGYTKDAAKKKVIVISQGNIKNPLEVNLLDLLKKGDMSKNIALKDGDLIYLMDNHRIDLSRDIMPVIGFWSIVRHY